MGPIALPYRTDVISRMYTLFSGRTRFHQRVTQSACAIDSAHARWQHLELSAHAYRTLSQCVRLRMSVARGCGNIRCYCQCAWVQAPEAETATLGLLRREERVRRTAPFDDAGPCCRLSEAVSRPAPGTHGPSALMCFVCSWSRERPPTPPKPAALVNRQFSVAGRRLCDVVTMRQFICIFPWS